jgi:hypothetical protein
MPTTEAKMGRTTLEFTIANNDDLTLARLGRLPADEVRRVTLQGVVDTGATRLVLPESAVKTLGLPSSGKATVRYADQRTASREIVMEDLDFLVDCVTQTLHPRDPNGIVSEVE